MTRRDDDKLVVPSKFIVPNSAEMAEMFTAVVEGREPNFPEPIAPSPVGSSKPMPLASEDFLFDKRKEGWELQEDVGFKPRIAGIWELELIPILGEGEENTCLNGQELVQRAKDLNAYFGQKHLEWLCQIRHLIPEKWRDYYVVAFGTQWCNQNDEVYIPILFWEENEMDVPDWVLEWHPLAEQDDFADDNRLLRLRRTQEVSFPIPSSWLKSN